MNRRRFLRGVGAGALAAGAGVAGYRFGEDTWDLRLSRLEVPVPRLPADLDGLRIAHLSDLHAGDDVPRDFIVSALRMADATRADIIVLTGDFVSHDWRRLEPIKDDLAALRAPLGVYACLGNHDHMHDRARHVTPLLQDAGITVLANDGLAIPGREDAWLIGLDDPATWRHDFDAALRNVPPPAFKLMLVHSPDIIESAADLGIDLVLAGHTHGGQVNLPLLGAPIVPSRYGSRYAWGLFDCRGTRLFVTRGVGLVAPVIRFLCPPEVALLTLRRSNAKLPDGRFGIDLRPTIRRLRDRARGLRRRPTGPARVG